MGRRYPATPRPRRRRRAPLLESLLARVGSAEYARRVDDKVDLAGRLHRRLELLRLGRIGDDIARAHLFGCGPQRFLSSRGEDDVVAELDQLAAAGLSDAAATAGDQGRSHAAPFSVGVGPALA